MSIEYQQAAAGISATNRASVLRAIPLLAASLLLVATLYGCAPLPPGERTLECHSAEQCRVEVSVVCEPSCHIAVDFDVVAANGKDIVWTVFNKPGQSYVFDHDAGIAFKTAAGREAFACHPEATDKRYKCMNRRTQGKFEYGVRLAGSPAVPPLDPWVVNR